jgi:two-component system, cell cycle sensor histidine kinase and response regulator CckA
MLQIMRFRLPLLSTLAAAIALFAQQYSPSLYNGMRWRQVGPFRAGRISAVAGVPGDPATYYLGTPGGGVWKSTSGGGLAGGIAHDFNNLLTVINGYSDLLIRQLIPGDPMHESVAEIRLAGKRATELVRQLLLLSRKQVAQASEVNLNGVIEEVGKMLARVIGEDIRLEFALDPSLGWILADPGQLHQVLMNLAVNARDAMPGGGTLLIETTNADLEESYAQQHVNVKPGPYVQLKVSDTGVGMTRDVISHIFEPFFSTKRPGEGTGLGLATVYGIVQQSGGSIWV